MRSSTRVLWLLLAAAAFGVLMAIVKGQMDDARGAVGNMSAPWVVMPFVAGIGFPKAWRAALMGIAVTELGFVAFYVAEAFILDLGPHPWYVDLDLTAGTIYIYEVLGLASGAVYGVLGSLWRARGVRGAGAALGLAFLAEPAAAWALAHGGVWGASDALTRFPALWIGEVVLGAGLVLAALLAPRPTSRA